MDITGEVQPPKTRTGLEMLELDVDELMKLAPKDIEKFVDGPSLRIKDWERLPVKDKDTCMSQLRHLARSFLLGETPWKPLDFSDLHWLLRASTPITEVQINCFRECRTPPVGDGYEWKAVQYGAEIESHEALIREGGIPSHSLRSELEGALAKYWKRKGAKNPPEEGFFFTQLAAWRRFQGFQREKRTRHLQDWRQYHHKVQDRRRKYRLEGDIILNSNLDLQDKLTTWLEYQDYHHCRFEELGGIVDHIREDMINRLYELKTPWEDQTMRPGVIFTPRRKDEWNIQDRETIRAPFALALEIRKSRLNALAMWKEANMKLRLARLRQVRASRLLDGIVDKKSWVGKLESEVKRREVHGSAYLEDYEQHPPLSGTDYRFNLKLARQALEVALNDFDETIEKEALMSNIQDEIRSAESKVNVLKMATQILSNKLRNSHWSELERRVKEYEEYCAFLDWIEEQRRIIASNPQVTKHDCQIEESKSGSHKEEVTGDEHINDKVQHEPNQKPQEEGLQDCGTKKTQEEAPCERLDAIEQQSIKPETTKKRSLEDDSTRDDSPRKRRKKDTEPTPVQADTLNDSLQAQAKLTIEQRKGISKAGRQAELKKLNSILNSITDRKWKKFTRGVTLSKREELKHLKALLRQIT